MSHLLPLNHAMKASVRILVVDDERILRDSCATALQFEGYQVEVCGRGEEALDALQRRLFDIVLVDLYMNGTGGTQLIGAALAANQDAIVIVITGKPTVETALETLRAGAWDYLPKPFTGSQLQVLVGRAAHTVHVGRETQALRAGAEVGAEDAVGLGTAPAFRESIALARRAPLAVGQRLYLC